MKLIISNVSGVPIYEQIKQQIKAAILSGELQAEETLPSLRTLAKDLKISVLTVTKAYTELEQEGFVKNVQGRGCFVMGSGSELIKEQLICKVENNLTEAIKAARMANLSTEELHRLSTSQYQLYFAKGIYYGLDRPEWFWQNNDNQTDFEYAQAHRWYSQSDGAG